MERRILAPAALDGSALAELKNWLAITTTQDDAALGAMLRAALELCEAFTGQMPLAAQCEEMLPARSGWQKLATRPVQAVTLVERVDSAGIRSPVPAEHYALELEGDGSARLRLLIAAEPERIAVRLTAGIAQSWGDLPDGLRHGVLRLAAHQFREREEGDLRTLPPAAVAALWRPWRRMLLA